MRHKDFGRFEVRNEGLLDAGVDGDDSLALLQVFILAFAKLLHKVKQTLFVFLKTHPVQALVQLQHSDFAADLAQSCTLTLQAHSELAGELFRCGSRPLLPLLLGISLQNVSQLAQADFNEVLLIDEGEVLKEVVHAHFLPVQVVADQSQKAVDQLEALPDGEAGVGGREQLLRAIQLAHTHKAGLGCLEWEHAQERDEGVVEVGLGEDGVEQPGEVLVELGRGGVVVAQEEGGDEGVHLGVHVEHAVEVVDAQVEHADQAGVDEGGRELEDAVGVLVLEQLVQAVLDDIAVLVMLQLPQHQVHQLQLLEHCALAALHQVVETPPHVLHQVRPVAAQYVEQLDEYFSQASVLAEAGRSPLIHLDGQQVHAASVLP